MKTKRITITAMIALLALITAIPVQAQHGHFKDKTDKERTEGYARMKSAKIAFITEHVNLSPEEAQTFWPLYNEMEQKREDITHNLMERFKHLDENEEVSEEQAEEIMQQRFAQEEALLDLKKEYHKKFTEVLPATRVLKLYEAEHKFRGMLMERLRGRDGERRPEGDRRRAPEKEKVEPR